MNYSEIETLINENLASGKKIPAYKHREVELALLAYIQANLSQSGDIKAIKCDLTYYTENFDTNGLGKNLRTGWAVCNGNNGTPNVSGRVIVGYGLGYSSFGAVGGSKDAVVVSHSHSVGALGNVSSSKTLRFGSNPNVETDFETLTTSEVGVSGVDKNMQPYIVQLYIMKL